MFQRCCEQKITNSKSQTRKGAFGCFEKNEKHTHKWRFFVSLGLGRFCQDFRASNLAFLAPTGFPWVPTHIACRILLSRAMQTRSSQVRLSKRVLELKIPLFWCRTFGLVAESLSLHRKKWGQNGILPRQRKDTKKNFLPCCGWFSNSKYS